MNKKPVRADIKTKIPKTVTKGIKFRTVTYEKIVDYAEVTHKRQQVEVVKI